MPDDSDSTSNLPGRHRPRLTDLSKETTEEDLWDLDEEDAPAPAESPTQEEQDQSDAESGDPGTESGKSAESRPQTKKTPPPEKREPAPKSPKTPDSTIGAKKESAEPPKPAETPKAGRPNGPNIRDLKTSKTPRKETPLPEETKKPEPKDEPKSEPTPAPAPEPEPEIAPESAPEPKAAAKASAAAPIASKEKIGLIALGVVVAGLAVWWLVGLFSSVPTTRIGDDEPDYPIEGRFLTVREGVTYWREPQRDGPRPDVARSDVEFLPVLSLTLKDSESGVLRAIFRDELGDFVGDSISQSFANGVFDANVGATIEFVATDGFKSPGEFNGYRVGEERWTVEIHEGPSADAPGSEFKLLLSAPVSPNRR